MQDLAKKLTFTWMIKKKSQTLIKLTGSLTQLQNPITTLFPANYIKFTPSVSIKKKKLS